MQLCNANMTEWIEVLLGVESLGTKGTLYYSIRRESELLPLIWRVLGPKEHCTTVLDGSPNFSHRSGESWDPRNIVLQY